MTPEEILEYNKRCAEFLDYVLITPEMRRDSTIEWKYGYWEHKDKANVHTSEKVLGRDGYLSFYSDWNWIMKVVEAIEKRSESIIMERLIYNSFDIGNRNIEFYFSPNNQYLLQLELKQIVSDEPRIHSMYKHHIIQQFDFKTKGKKKAVVQAINQFLIWYNKNV